MKHGGVILDFSAVEQMLPVLEALAAGDVPKTAQLDSLIATPGMQVWLAHARKFGGVTEGSYRQLVSEVAQGRERSGSRLWNYLKRQVGRLPELRRVFAALRAVDFQSLCAEAVAQANVHQPQPFDSLVRVYFICAVRGSAIVLGDAMVLDIADFPDPLVTPLPLAEIQSTIAHEAFHMGRGRQLEQPYTRLSGCLRAACELLGLLVEEGVPTMLFNGKHNLVMIGIDWQQAMDRISFTRQRVEQLLVSGLSGQMEAEQLRQEAYCLFGLDGYALGQRMCEVLVQHLGWNALHSVLADHVQLPVLYNQAVAVGGLTDQPFPADLATSFQMLGQI